MTEAFNKHVLRRLFNRDGSGKGVKGETHRTYIHTSLSHLTYQGLAQAITLGQGGYAAPVVDMAVRLILYLVGTVGLDAVGEYLLLAINDRPALIQRLRDLADYIEHQVGERS